MTSRKRGGTAGGGSGRKGVTYTAQEEPAFIKRFKEKVGYVEEEQDIDAKRSSNKVPYDSDDDDLLESEENKPLVVVLKAGDLTEEEAERIAAQNKTEEELQPPKDGRIIFKKPVKRTSDTNEGLTSSSGAAKQKKLSLQDKIKNKETDNKTKKVVSTSLLSFDEDEG